MPRKFLLTAAAVVFVLVFVWTCYSLMSAEIKQGNVYAPYSTFRTAPSGTRVLFDSLGDSGENPKRNVLPLLHVFKEPPRTLIFLGMSAYDLYDLPPKTADSLNDFVENGGNLIITEPSNLKPETSDSGTDTGTSSEDSSSSSSPADSPDSSPSQDDEEGSAVGISVKHKHAPDDDSISQEEFERRRHEEIKDEIKKTPGGDPDSFPDYVPSLLARWGFGVDSYPTKDPKDTFPDQLPVGAEPHLPWRSNFYFVRIAPEWKVLYRIEHRPVALSRALGKGHITVLSDSYIFTNEAMRDDRRVGFLAWLLGNDEAPVFDETHLGSESGRGIASVISSLGFEGYIVGALFVFLLYVWRNSCPLQPIQSDEMMAATKGTDGAVAGRDARSGLVNLLRRNIPERNLVQVCLTEWKRSQTHGGSALAPKIKASEEIAQNLPASELELLESYRKISAVLNEKPFLSKNPQPPT